MPVTLQGWVVYRVAALARQHLSFILQGERFVGAISSMKARAPVTGGNFGIWGGMFSTFDCAVKGWRQKEDAWNAIISGFMTGGCLALRSMLHLLLRTLLS